jgi:hypothetical protein
VNTVDNLTKVEKITPEEQGCNERKLIMPYPDFQLSTEALSDFCDLNWITLTAGYRIFAAIDVCTAHIPEIVLRNLSPGYGAGC